MNKYIIKMQLLICAALFITEFFGAEIQQDKDKKDTEDMREREKNISDYYAVVGFPNFHRASPLKESLCTPEELEVLRLLAFKGIARQGHVKEKQKEAPK